MYKAWFDASYFPETRLAILGFCIEDENGLSVHSNSIIRKNLENSSHAETLALISLLETIKEKYKNKRFQIFGDEQGLIFTINSRKNSENILINYSKRLLKDCNISPSSLTWTERTFNKADAYTRVLEIEPVVETLEDKNFKLLDKPYQEYISYTKGNNHLSLEQAEYKLNRNIKRSKTGYLTLSDGSVVYMYYSLHIFTKDGKIFKVCNRKGDALGLRYYKDNIHILEEEKKEAYALN